MAHTKVESHPAVGIFSKSTPESPDDGMMGLDSGRHASVYLPSTLFTSELPRQPPKKHSRGVFRAFVRHEPVSYTARCSQAHHSSMYIHIYIHWKVICFWYI